MTNLVEIQKEIKQELGNKETMNALVQTTFKGLNPAVVPTAILEGMTRGFKFKDFLEKNVYAVPFGNNYSLVTSIDYARKIGMRSGVVGKSAPSFTFKENKAIDSCSVTIKRKVGDYVGEYTATVFFDEYSTGRNLWTSKPKTMIAKVAEMHALRMACPEELAQSYVEEEMVSEHQIAAKQLDVTPYKAKLEASKSLEELKVVWSALPIEAKQQLEEVKNQLKNSYANSKVQG